LSDSNAWLGSLELKEEILRDLAEDLQLERYVQGSYITGANDDDQAFYGCHVGCLMMARACYDNRRDSNPLRLVDLVTETLERGYLWHGHVPEKLGMPRDLAEFWDKTYEKLPPDLAPRFAVQSLQCVPVGADLRNVLARLIAWLLDDPQAGFLAGAREPQKTAELKTGSYLVMLGALWTQRAQDYTKPAHVPLDVTANLEDLADEIPAIGTDIEDNLGSPFYWATMAMHSAIRGTVTHHIAGALIDEWADAFENRAIGFPADYDPLDEDAGDNPLWFIARKFFDLCATSPQGNQT
jgi:hypothetical protein